MEKTLVSIPEDLGKKYLSFKLKRTKGSCAIINKINVPSRTVEIEQEIDELNLDDLSTELSPCEPRYVLISYEYHHNDGRISYPYCLIFSSPRGSPLDLKMLYVGSLHHFANISQVTKIFELHDVEELTEDWLKEEMRTKCY